MFFKTELLYEFSCRAFEAECVGVLNVGLLKSNPLELQAMQGCLMALHSYECQRLRVFRLEASPAG